MKSDEGRTVVIRSSPIHGKGLFACRAIKAGEVVTQWAPLILSGAQIKTLSEIEKKYISRRGGKVMLNQEPERYMNHSCAPNTKVLNFRDVALRDIAAGEEVTTDYAFDNPIGYKAPCTCRATHCTGWIAGKAQLNMDDEGTEMDDSVIPSRYDFE